MACRRYEILLVDIKGKGKQKREWTETQLLGSVAWLKRMNARGHDVLIRPSTRAGLVLLDRLTQGDVSRLENLGVPVCAKIQVEADEFQVWLRLGNSAVGERVYERMATSLGLPKSKATNFGALAGFTTHHPQVLGDRNSYVLAHEPARHGLQSIARWERMLTDAEKLVRNQERDKTLSRTKGFSR